MRASPMRIASKARSPLVSVNQSRRPDPVHPAVHRRTRPASAIDASTADAHCDFANGHSTSHVGVAVPEQEHDYAGNSREPSVGLEPTTPSLPRKFGCPTGVSGAVESPNSEFFRPCRTRKNGMRVPRTPPRSPVRTSTHFFLKEEVRGVDGHAGEPVEGRFTAGRSAAADPQVRSRRRPVSERRPDR